MDVLNSTKSFLSNPFNRNLVIFLLGLGLILHAFPMGQSTTQDSPFPVQNTSLNDSTINGSSVLDVHFFFSPTCPHCSAQKPINEKIMADFPNANFIYHDATIQKEAELMIKMIEELGGDTSRLGVPTTIVGKQIFVGFDSSGSTEQQIRTAISTCVRDCINNPHYISDEKDQVITEFEEGEKTSIDEVLQKEEQIGQIELPIIGKIDVKTLSLPALAMTLGFIDGFNPCAMWVLVYLISILANIQDKKRMWIIVGVFLLSSGILYFLFMTAWLNFFLLIGYVRIITLLVGLFALGSGILSIKSFIETKGDLTCEVGDEDDHKKTMNDIQKAVTAPLTLVTIVGIAVLAFAVNSIEFVCSAGIPAVFTQVLALSNLGFFEYYGYILLYTIFFMLDDMIIFGMAAYALSTDFGQKYAKYCKILGGIIMALLGILLLFFPNLMH